MRPYTHPNDAGLKFQRTIGKKRWKHAAIAKTAPHELDGEKEIVHQELIQGELEDAGTPYIVIPPYVYALLKREAAKGDFRAMEALAALKDVPDLIPLRKVEGESYTRALLLEMKRAKGGKASPGQKRIIAAAGGIVAHGYIPAAAAIKQFMEAK